MKLYEFGPTRSLRVRWILHELKVEFEAVKVDMKKGEHTREPFLSINPAGKLPALEDDGFVITESVAIVLYLAEKYPDRGFMPVDLRQRAKVYQWCLFVATELEQPLWRIARHNNFYPEDKRLPGEIQLAREDFKRAAPILDQHLAGREFITDKIGAADFVTAYTLDWANQVKLLKDFPNLQAYLERMYARPTAPIRIAEAMQEIR